MKRRANSKRGQTMVEYIIIVVIIAIAAIAIFGIFGDTIRQKLSGAVVELGGSEDEAKKAAGDYGDSQLWLKDLGKDGAGTAQN
ncbi:MAG: pilus assembly protein [Lentisphaerae bacterium]|nr:pilus assembly protein [Lentisphaerota bacterium]